MARLTPCAPTVEAALPFLRSGIIDLALVGEWGPTAQSWSQRFGVRIQSPEAGSGVRRAWANRHVDQIVASGRLSEDAVLAPYAAPEATTPWLRCLAVDPATKSAIDDMVATWASLDKRGVPVPRHTTLSARCTTRIRGGADHRIDYLRLPRSSAGSGVVLAHDRGAVDRLLRGYPADAPVLASEHWGDGQTLNVHGLVTIDDEVLVLPPSVQVTGVGTLGAHPTQYCGSDFVSATTLPPETLDAVRSVVDAVGTWLTELRYRGLFGVDVALGPAGPAVLDVNPRMQASTWLLSESSYAAGQACPTMRHVRSLGFGACRERTPCGTTPRPFAQLVLRARNEVMAPSICPGGYSQEGRWAGESGLDMTPVDLATAEILLCGLPPPGTVVRRGATVARAVTRQAITDGGDLNAWGRYLTGWLASFVGGSRGAAIEPSAKII